MAEHDSFANVAPQKFLVDLHVDNKMERSLVTALDLNSLMAHLNVVLSLYLSRIPGYAVYDETGKRCLASVNATEFIAGIKALQKAPTNVAGGQPPPGRGWSAVPVVTPTTEEFQQAVNNRRRPQDGAADAAGRPAAGPAVTLPPPPPAAPTPPPGGKP